MRGQGRQGGQGGQEILDFRFAILDSNVKSKIQNPKLFPMPNAPCPMPHAPCPMTNDN